MWRRVVRSGLPGVLVGSVYLLASEETIGLKTNCKEWLLNQRDLDPSAYNSEGFPSKMFPCLSIEPQPHPLYFASLGHLCTAEGLKRKVCHVAIYLSKDTKEHVARFYKCRKECTQLRGEELTDCLLTKDSVTPSQLVYNPIKISVMLRIDAREETEELLSMLNHSMGCSTEAFQYFSKAFRSSVGDKQLSGDEIAIYWHDNNDVTIAKNGGNHVTISHPEVSYELLDSFCNSRKSLSVDLAKGLEDNL